MFSRLQYLDTSSASNVWTMGPSLLTPTRSHFGLSAMPAGYLIAAGGSTGTGTTVEDITQTEAVDVPSQ